MRRLKRFIGRVAPIPLLALSIHGCAGDGSRIPDEMVNGGGLQPTLASLQENVFTPFCTDCHVPGGPGPMPLDSEAVTFQSLVNARSIEVPTMFRVAPGDPENSYLVWKIEGRAQILLDRMPPPPKAMLEQEQIDAVVEWIRQGASP